MGLSEYLARAFPYHRAIRYSMNDLHILPGRLWGGRFQVTVTMVWDVTDGQEGDP
jgi:hypothetical protein